MVMIALVILSLLWALRAGAAAAAAAAAAADTSSSSGSGGGGGASSSSQHQCKGLWRPEQLVGRCFGLKQYTDFPQFATTSHNTGAAAAAATEQQQQQQLTLTANACRHMCCMAGKDCVSWQFQSNPKMCFLGDVIRLGTESYKTGVSDWCEPKAPEKWHGRRLEKRMSSTAGSGGVGSPLCVWGEHIPAQCFGLGAERRSSSSSSSNSSGDSGSGDGGDAALNTEQCAAACCADPDCTMWQEIPGRGCFYGHKRDTWCGNATLITSYHGGRKCIPGYCGGGGTGAEDTDCIQQG
jgi:hypothetical protein